MTPAIDRPISIAGRVLQPTPVFTSYWRFAAERHRVYRQRVEGKPPPWTDDQVIAQNRFTNAFRAADRVSQFLIREVLYSGAYDERSTVFRTLLFKFFNKVETWQHLEHDLGELDPDGYTFDRYGASLAKLFHERRKLYSAAYVVPPPKFGEQRKYLNHLRLLEYVLRPQVLHPLLASSSMAEAFHTLRRVPSLGDFLAYQLVTDLNYSDIFRFSELEFVVAGPGARDGIRKCFGPAAVGIEPEVVKWMVDNQEELCSELAVDAPSLWGRQLQLIDAQNLFCEVDKYARVAHPEVSTPTGRTRIKQKYRESVQALDPPFFPPDWGLALPAPVKIEASQTVEQLALV